MDDTRIDDDGCEALDEAQSDGSINIRKIFSVPIPNSEGKIHTVYFAEILSSIGKTPCQYLNSTFSHSTCHLLRKGAQLDGKSWDYYIINCPYGPPCVSLESL
jgi:hypothetical protein